MNVCGTKPPPKLSSANSVDRRRMIPRERCRGGNASASSSSPRSTAGERLAAATSPAAAASRYASSQRGEEPKSASNAAERAGKRGDGVVGAEQARDVAAGVGEHRLLERGERSRLDHVGRDGAGQGGDEQRWQRARQREDGSGGAHNDEQDSVAAAPPDPVAVARKQHRDRSRPRQQ